MRHASIPTVLFAAVATLFVACGGGEPVREAETDSAATSPTAGESAPPAAGDAVTYEPAYPEEVSAEGLSDEDAAQQEGAHSHDGEAGHDHAGGEHSHDGEAGDDHGHDH